MTKNQIDYASLKETERSNRAAEAENFRHNFRTEELGFKNLDESRRHNVATESNQFFQVHEQARHNLAGEQETNRHNLISEEYGLKQINETARHNVQQEKLGFATLGESRRHNIANESFNLQNLSEAHRHNLASELNQRYATDVTKSYNEGQLQIRTKEQQEAARHNLASEITEASRVAGQVGRWTAQSIEEVRHHQADEMNDRLGLLKRNTVNNNFDVGGGGYYTNPAPGQNYSRPKFWLGVQGSYDGNWLIPGNNYRVGFGFD